MEQISLSFRLNFTDIDLAGLNAEEDITPQEVRSIFENPKSRYLFTKDIFFIIGYSHHKRIIQVAFRVAESIYFDLDILQIEIPDEEEIEQFYCQSCQPRNENAENRLF
ncbi:MAG: hypothetical protein H7Y04_06905 [Verrucomicrobia bacterium]|nr:hypothetical protein [Cytophagales bacterium]